jgi:AcrR family transcriptional regulator
MNTPAEPPERSSDRRHREIREAAIDSFLASGYEGTTMEEIAARAGVSKQTVYKHFTDKQHLFADIVLSTTDDMSALIGHHRRQAASNLRPRRDLEHLAETFLVALMQPRVLRLRRLVISSADRFPRSASAWYEKGLRASPRSAREQFPRPCGPPLTRSRRRDCGSGALRRHVVLDPGQQGHVHRRRRLRGHARSGSCGQDGGCRVHECLRIPQR